MALAEEQDGTSQRLFFALWPDASTRAALVQAQGAMSECGGQAMHPDDLHVTLAFLGEVAASQITCVQMAAERVQVDAFDMRFTCRGSWSGARVAWVAPNQSPPALQALVQQLWQGLAVCGYRPEDGPYRPHVTLWRKAAMVTDATLSVAIPWKAYDFVLVCALPERQVPRYNVLHRWPLQGSAL